LEVREAYEPFPHEPQQEHPGELPPGGFDVEQPRNCRINWRLETGSLPLLLPLSKFPILRRMGELSKSAITLIFTNGSLWPPEPSKFARTLRVMRLLLLLPPPTTPNIVLRSSALPPPPLVLLGEDPLLAQSKFVKSAKTLTFKFWSNALTLTPPLPPELYVSPSIGLASPVLLAIKVNRHRSGSTLTVGFIFVKIIFKPDDTRIVLKSETII